MKKLMWGLLVFVLVVLVLVAIGVNYFVTSPSDVEAGLNTAVNAIRSITTLSKSIKPDNDDGPGVILTLIKLIGALFVARLFLLYVRRNSNLLPFKDDGNEDK